MHFHQLGGQILGVSLLNLLKVKVGQQRQELKSNSSTPKPHMSQSSVPQTLYMQHRLTLIRSSNTRKQHGHKETKKLHGGHGWTLKPSQLSH